MEQKRNFRGLKKYEPLLHTICRTDDYYRLTEEEWEGCLGVACVISVIEGVNSSMFSLSKHLDIPHYNCNLQHAFERLRVNGVFTSKQGIQDDPMLKGEAINGKWMTAAEMERNAWCTVAGVAGGFIGVGKKMPKSKKMEERKEYVDDEN